MNRPTLRAIARLLTPWRRPLHRRHRSLQLYQAPRQALQGLRVVHLGGQTVDELPLQLRPREHRHRPPGRLEMTGRRWAHVGINPNRFGLSHASTI